MRTLSGVPVAPGLVFFFFCSEHKAAFHLFSA